MIMSRLILIYAVCKSLLFSPMTVKGLIKKKLPKGKQILLEGATIPCKSGPMGKEAHTCTVLLQGSNPDGSFTVDDSNSFFQSLQNSSNSSRKQIFRDFFSYFIMELYVVCTH